MQTRVREILLYDDRRGVNVSAYIIDEIVTPSGLFITWPGHHTTKQAALDRIARETAQKS